MNFCDVPGLRQLYIFFAKENTSDTENGFLTTQDGHKWTVIKVNKNGIAAENQHICDTFPTLLNKVRITIICLILSMILPLQFLGLLFQLLNGKECATFITKVTTKISDIYAREILIPDRNINHLKV